MVWAATPPSSGRLAMVVATWGVGQVLWSMMWFFLLFLWIWLAIAVFTDIFRSHDMGGLAKAVWVVFVVFLPFVGILAYLIARGHKMSEHALQQAQAQDAAARSYIRDAAAPVEAGPASELNRLIDLREQGVISDAEYEQM